MPKRAEVRLPSVMYDLINSSLATFGRPEFGTVIKPLREEDVRICKTASMDRYIEEQGKLENHPIIGQSAEKLAKQFPGKVLQRSDKESGVMIATVTNLPGKPVFIPEAAIKRITNDRSIPEELRIAFLIEGMGKILVHESMHRTTAVEEPFPVDMSDPLVAMAWSTSKWIAEAQGDPSARAAFTEYNEEILDYAARHDPHIHIEGTRVKLLCADDEGRQRFVFESGYDLGEAIPELLTLQSLDPIRSYVRRNYGAYLEQGCFEQIMVQVVSNDNFRFGNILGEALPYLERLGIEGPIEVLNAFASGKIPRLHAQLLPDEDYMR